MTARDRSAGPAERPRAVDGLSWFALLLGTTVGPILVDISQGLPRTRWGWAALVVGAALMTGLLAATAMERAGRSGGRHGRRRWRPRANRRQLVVLGVIVLLVLTAFWGNRMWQRTRPCGEAVGLPVAAAPSVLPAIRDVARVWVDETRRPGGCPRYAVYLDQATDPQVRRALLHGGSTGAGQLGSGGEDEPGTDGTAAVRVGAEPRPVPLIWFPDDFRQVDALTGPGSPATRGAVVVRKQVYAASAVAVALPPGLVGGGDAAGAWTMHGLAAAVADGRVRLLRPDPRTSALALLASAAMYPGGSSRDRTRRIDVLEEALSGTASSVRGGGGARSGSAVAVQGPGPADVTRVMCRGNGSELAFVVAERSLRAVREAPANEVTGCRRPPGGLAGARPVTDSGEDLLLSRAVAVLRPDPGRAPVPSPAAVEAAAAFVDWLGGPRGQGRLEAAGFDLLPGGGPRTAPPGQPLDRAQADLLTDAGQQFADSAARRLEPHDVMVVLDASGSMASPLVQGSSRYGASVAALAATVAARRGVNDRIGVVRFGAGTASVAVDLTSHPDVPQRIRTALDRRSPSGSTPLAAGIRAGADALGGGEGHPQNRSLLVVTDGGRVSDRSRLAGALGLATDRGVTIRVVVVGTSCRSVTASVRTGGLGCVSASGADLPIVLDRVLESVLAPAPASGAGGSRT